MSTTIDIKFVNLDGHIAKLQALLDKMEEPSYNDLEFWLGDISGSGQVVSNLYAFCNRTIEYHRAVYKLIENTIKYLNNVKKLQEEDQKIADRL